jgi:catechol 2,3-dioxygenase-like lactoylglutathione lyase family enzyme
MKRTWTIIGVSDVPVSFKWYQSLFGQADTRPAHDYFGQIVDSDGTVLLSLHQRGAHGHPSLTSRDAAAPGNGLLLFFRVDDFDSCLKRARALVDRLEEEPHGNPNTRTEEFSLRDPDGYYVTISALSALELQGHEPPAISGVSPFFIVQNAASALSFYRDRLGFEITFQEPADDPFFGIVCRGGAMIMLKSVGVDPLPNYTRERAARWDAYLSVADPDALAGEFASRGVEFSEPLKDTHDGLRGFEIKDADGYVLFFGHPRS